MHWFDVRPEYFEAYKKHLDPFFKDPNGVIMDYDEVANSRIYNEPFYTEAEKDKIAPDGRLLHLRSQEHWAKCSETTQNLKIYRTFGVSFFTQINKMYKLCINMYRNIFVYYIYKCV